jgi:hypothetical protein
MKSIRIFGLLFVLVLILGACQSKPTPTSAPVAAPVQEEQGEPYPPINTVLTPTNPPVMYPDAKSGDLIPYYQVTSLITNGEVSKIVQTKDLKLFVTLKDGRTFNALEPLLDDVVNVVKQCGTPCKDVRIATE